MLIYTLSTGHKLGLGLIALAFVGFALVTSMVIPRRNPGFPGRNLTAFALVTIVLFAATLFGVFWFGREAEGEIGTKGSVPAETAPTPQSGESVPAPTTSESTTTTAAGGGDLAAGKKVFADAGCGGCHALADAGASGTVGPNLDEVKPSEDKVATQVRNGGSVMPAFGDRLSDEEIQAVAHYVATVAGS